MLYIYIALFRLHIIEMALQAPCNFPAQAPSTVSFLCEGDHLLLSQLSGEHTGHDAASRQSEPIWNAHYCSTHHQCWYSFYKVMEG